MCELDEAKNEVNTPNHGCLEGTRPSCGGTSSQSAKTQLEAQESKTRLSFDYCREGSRKRKIKRSMPQHIDPS